MLLCVGYNMSKGKKNETTLYSISLVIIGMLDYP